eukprot:gene4405-8765_t
MAMTAYDSDSIQNYFMFGICDYYSILGVTNESDDHEIKKHYRKLALELHPDKIPSNASDEFRAFALEKFLAIKDAYETLIDPEKRLQYNLRNNDVTFETTARNIKVDRYTSRPFMTYIKTKRYKLTFSAVFEVIPIPPIIINIHTDISNVFTGIVLNHTFVRRIICPACNGNGGKEGVCRKCTLCGGTGHTIHFLNIHNSYEQMTHTTCGTCNGQGCIPEGKCDKCRGSGMVLKQEDISIGLPIGFKNGEQVYFRGFGNQMKDGRVGDVALQIWYDIPSGWTIDSDYNLSYEMKRPLQDMLNGFKEILQTPARENITIICPSNLTMDNVTEGILIPIENKGMVNNVGQRGYLLVTIKATWERMPAMSLLDILRLSGLDVNDPSYRFLQELLDNNSMDDNINEDLDSLFGVHTEDISFTNTTTTTATNENKSIIIIEEDVESDTLQLCCNRVSGLHCRCLSLKRWMHILCMVAFLLLSWSTAWVSCLLSVLSSSERIVLDEILFNGIWESGSEVEFIRSWMGRVDCYIVMKGSEKMKCLFEYVYRCWGLVFGRRGEGRNIVNAVPLGDVLAVASPSVSRRYTTSAMLTHLREPGEEGEIAIVHAFSNFGIPPFGSSLSCWYSHWQLRDQLGLKSISVGLGHFVFMSDFQREFI